MFEKTAQSWIERGRGLLRLNDMASTDDGSLQSRLGKDVWPELSLGQSALVQKVDSSFFYFDLDANAVGT